MLPQGSSGSRALSPAGPDERPAGADEVPGQGPQVEVAAGRRAPGPPRRPLVRPRHRGSGLRKSSCWSCSCSSHDSILVATRPVRLGRTRQRRTGVRSPIVAQRIGTGPSILRPRTSLAHFDYQPPSGPGRARWISWSSQPLDGDLGPRARAESYTAQTLPYPCVNLSVTNTEADVTGLTRRLLLPAPDAVRLRGRRAVPAGVLPAVDRRAGPGLTDRHRPIAKCSGATPPSWSGGSQRPVEPGGSGSRTWRPSSPRAGRTPDETAQRLAESGRDWSPGTARITRVGPGGRAGRAVGAQPAADSSPSTSAPGPKWVIQRCRLQDAAARVSPPTRPSTGPAWPTELGFADQAHLTRAFTATIGIPPAAYARAGARADLERPVSGVGVSGALRTHVR